MLVMISTVKKRLARMMKMLMMLRITRVNTDANGTLPNNKDPLNWGPYAASQKARVHARQLETHTQPQHCFNALTS